MVPQTLCSGEGGASGHLHAGQEGGGEEGEVREDKDVHGQRICVEVKINYCFVLMFTQALGGYMIGKCSHAALHTPHPCTMGFVCESYERRQKMLACTIGKG